jgi:hypothetical protein
MQLVGKRRDRRGNMSGEWEEGTEAPTFGKDTTTFAPKESAQKTVRE